MKAAFMSRLFSLLRQFPRSSEFPVLFFIAQMTNSPISFGFTRIFQKQSGKYCIKRLLSLQSELLGVISNLQISRVIRLNDVIAGRAESWRIGQLGYSG